METSWKGRSQAPCRVAEVVTNTLWTIIPGLTFCEAFICSLKNNHQTNSHGCVCVEMVTLHVEHIAMYCSPFWHSWFRKVELVMPLDNEEAHAPLCYICPSPTVSAYLFFLSIEFLTLGSTQGPIYLCYKLEYSLQIIIRLLKIN